MDRNEIDRRNEDFKNKNAAFIGKIVAQEENTINFINANYLDSLTTMAPVLSDKVSELLSLFESADKPIEAHYIVVLESQYFTKLLFDRMKSIDEFYLALNDALEKDDMDRAAAILGKKATLSKEWQSIVEQLENFDYQDNLEDALNSDVPLAQRGPKDKLEEVCRKELQSINYEPKARGGNHI